MFMFVIMLNRLERMAGVMDKVLEFVLREVI